MPSHGIIFALLTTLSWAICIFPFTQAARRLGSNTLNNFRLLLAAIIVGLFTYFYRPAEFTAIFSSNYSQAWFWLSISGVLGLTIGDYFAFSMYKILGARTGSVLTTFAPAATLFLGSLMIDERISVIGIAGIIVTILGVNFVSLGKRERDKIPDHGHGSITKGIIAGVLSALCQGAGLVLAKKGFQSLPGEFTLSPFNATFMRLITAASALFLFTLFSGSIRKVYSPIFSNKNNGVKYAIAGTIFGPTLGVCLALFTVSILEASVAQTIFSLVPAVAFLLAAIFLKEKITVQSVLGLLMAITGVMILIWRDVLAEIM